MEQTGSGLVSLSPGLEMVASWNGGGIGRFSSKDTQLSSLLWRGVKDISLFMHPSCCRYSAQWMRHGVAVCSPFPDQASAHQSKQGGAGCVCWVVT